MPFNVYLNYNETVKQNKFIFQCFESVKLIYHETDWDVELGLVFADVRLRSFGKLEVTGGASDRLFVLRNNYSKSISSLR
jgi:hypothetical protein